MSAADPGHLLEEYRAGLEAEIALLKQLDIVVARQREVTESRDFERFAIESDVRERLTRQLVTIEEGVAEVRKALKACGRDAVARLDAFQPVVELRRQAAELIARITATDQASMKALGDAELARRAALASLTRGETTLAAYRRVIAPPVSQAALLNRRG